MQITKQQVLGAKSFLTNSRFVNDKNKWAVARNIKKLNSIVEEIEERRAELQLKYAFLDEDKCPVKNLNGAYKFSTENIKKLNDEFAAYLKETIEFDPYKFTSNPEVESVVLIFISSNLEFLLDEELLKEPV